MKLHAILSFCRIGLIMLSLLSLAKGADETVSGNLTVTGDATIGGVLAVASDIDAEGDNLTLGSQSSSYGLGVFYEGTGSDGVRWRLRRAAGWLWEVDNSGVTPSMRLDSANKLILYSSSTAGVTLDPSAKSIALGDAALYRDANGDLKTDEGFVAVGSITGSNLSGTNTGDQTRADLGVDVTDSVTFASLSASGMVTGSNLSGTNTGDQVITLTGDVTGSGAGAFAATISADSVALGIDTTGDYVATVAGDAEVVVSGGGSEGRVVTFSLGSSITRDSELPTRDSMGLDTDDNVTFADIDAGGLELTGELKVSGTGNTVMKGPVLLVPQGDLSMGSFTEGPDPTSL